MRQTFRLHQVRASAGSHRRILVTQFAAQAILRSFIARGNTGSGAVWMRPAVADARHRRAG